MKEYVPLYSPQTTRSKGLIQSRKHKNGLLAKIVQIIIQSLSQLFRISIISGIPKVSNKTRIFQIFFRIVF